MTKLLDRRRRKAEIKRDFDWIECRFGEDDWAVIGDAPNTAVAAARLIAAATNPGQAVSGPSRSMIVALERLRGFATDVNTKWMVHGAVAAMADLPLEWLPSETATIMDWTSAIAVSHTAWELHEVTERPCKNILRGATPDGWTRYVEEIVELGGFGDAGDIKEDLYNTTCGLQDMISAFAHEVLLPAMKRLGVAAPEAGSVRQLSFFAGEEPYVETAAMRLLMRGKSLRAFVESSTRWHARTTAIGEMVTVLASAKGLRWKVPYPPSTNAEGTLLLDFIGDAHALLDEGRAGKDINGIDGLQHCVASYLRDVGTGQCALVSIKGLDDRGAVMRVSTAELGVGHNGRVEVVQHYGRRNTAPHRLAAKALDGLITVINANPCRLGAFKDAMRDNAAENGGRCLYDPGIPGSVERALDAWAFALPRHLRGAGPEAVLRAGGLLEPEARETVGMQVEYRSNGVEEASGGPSP